MSTQSVLSKIAQAARSKSIYEAALAYQEIGFSVLPLKGKRPAIRSWADRQHHAATALNIEVWHQAHHLQNVGIVCGTVSGNLVVLDLDGAAGYPAFAAQFPELAETYTVATGGGTGKHVYWRVEEISETVKAMGTPIGNLELCANGRQVVAPPSIHPDTQKQYVVEKPLDILRVPDLNDLVAWIESFKPNVSDKPFRPTHHNPNGDVVINPDVIREIESHFISQGFKQMRDWLHGPCIYPHRHKNGDRHPSFGFNLTSSYAYCYVCGTILAKDVCEAIGIRPDDYGGLVDKAQSVNSDRSIRQSSTSLSRAPISTVNTAEDHGLRGNDHPPDEFDLEELPLPDLLRVYMKWAGAVGNETPLSFHCFSFFWLVATAVGRRLATQTTWGQRIHANLYLMIVAPSTYYRKSTACNLAHQIADAAFPHLMMPAPGSPERLLTSLAGQKPRNFDELPTDQQEEWRAARPFASQRALHFDEVAGLLGALNRKEYMQGMKDQLLELYDCPVQMSRDTQNGLTIIKKPSLSILGVTTPAALASAVVQADWSNGLFSRFALITPEANYGERSALTDPLRVPSELITGLRSLFDRLPQPKNDEETDTTPLIPEWDMSVQIWDAVRAYSQQLRNLCSPLLENPLDERLRPVYGRLHVMALKLAMLCAVIRWIETGDEKPNVSEKDWQIAQYLAEYLRGSAHRLLEQLDRSGDASREMTLQDRVLRMCEESGANGCTIRQMCRAFHTLAAPTRDAAKELTKAGLLVEQQVGRTERYVLAKLMDVPTGMDQVSPSQ